MGKVASQIRLEEILFEKVKAIAERELRTMNAQLEYFIRSCIDAYEKENGGISIQIPPLADLDGQ